MSSAYEVSCCGAGGCGMPDMYMLKSVGKRKPPLGIPVLNLRCFNMCYLIVVHALRPLI